MRSLLVPNEPGHPMSQFPENAMNWALSEIIAFFHYSPAGVVKNGLRKWARFSIFGRGVAPTLFAPANVDETPAAWAPFLAALGQRKRPALADR